MPPAFNLSQDQTLHLKKFDLFKVTQSTLAPSQLLAKSGQDLRPHPLRNESVFASCEHLICLFTPDQHHSRDTTPERHDIQAPTPIGCKFLRNRPRIRPAAQQKTERRKTRGKEARLYRENDQGQQPGRFAAQGTSRVGALRAHRRRPRTAGGRRPRPLFSRMLRARALKCAARHGGGPFRAMSLRW